MDELGQRVCIPDFWQAEALSHLRKGRDLVVHAPTGAGKTFIFEMFFEREFDGRAVYTVPTRALANDKYEQWKSAGWRVGIATGDYSVDTDSPLVVATLETQKSRIFSKKMPDLLVIDEYQLLADPLRGANYELAIAMSPPGTQLLMLSGSVGNPQDVIKWLGRLGRDAALVSHSERAVPLEEVAMEALPDVRAKNIRGLWPRLVQRVVEADMAPLLIFAPRRGEAESIARQLAAELPQGDFLSLPRETAALAGKELSGMMRKRIAYHHSGLSAAQRSKVVEKYARAGELKVVVATTGLGAGINFSMRSAIITDREYESGGKARALRPDELLQMYGRVGRRGRDKAGYAISIPGKPRLSEANFLQLGRASGLDWPSILRIMGDAFERGEDGAKAARDFCSRLFSDDVPPLGLEALKGGADKAYEKTPALKAASRIEILNSKMFWERRKPSAVAPLSGVLFFEKDAWIPFLSSASAVMLLKRGRACRLDGGSYGLCVNVANAESQNRFRLVKKLRKEVGKLRKEHAHLKPLLTDDLLGLKNIRRNLPKFLEKIYPGASCASFDEKGGSIFARLDISNSKIKTVCDSYGARLFNPKTRAVDVSHEGDFAKLSGLGRELRARGESVAEVWQRMGLIGPGARPTLRGRIFSFFNGGEGLAVAAAIGDETYALEDLAFDVANLRAGHRFGLSHTKTSVSSRLADVSRLAYSMASLDGYLNAGVPLTYGDGAAEAVREVWAGRSFQSLEGDILRRGDVERAYLEWQSMLRHIASCPDAPSERWMEFKRIAAGFSR